MREIKPQEVVDLCKISNIFYKNFIYRERSYNL